MGPAAPGVLGAEQAGWRAARRGKGERHKFSAAACWPPPRRNLPPGPRLVSAWPPFSVISWWQFPFLKMPQPTTGPSGLAQCVTIPPSPVPPPVPGPSGPRPLSCPLWVPRLCPSTVLPGAPQRQGGALSRGEWTRGLWVVTRRGGTGRNRCWGTPWFLSGRASEGLGIVASACGRRRRAAAAPAPRTDAGRGVSERGEGPEPGQRRHRWFKEQTQSLSHRSSPLQGDTVL